ncbi:MAG TPA: hypothetical protein VF575_05025 [Candidatus Saccharimonadales bacterium]
MNRASRVKNVSQKYWLPLAIVMLLSVCGLAVLRGSSAATPFISSEAENGSLADGAIVNADTGASMAKAVKFNRPAGPPSTTTRGSFVERPCTRTYTLSGMQVGTTGDAVANGNRMRAVLAAAVSGDCITVAAGHYRLSGNIEFTVPNVTLKGLGANREAVWFEHTTESRALFMIKAGGIHLYNFTHRVFGTARSSLGQSGEGNIWAQGGHSGLRMQDVLAWGSRDAAIFMYGVHNFEFNRVESRDSMSDAYHITHGSSGGKWFDCVSRNSGDDGIGIVGYDSGTALVPHHMTVVRHHVAGQTWGRGIGIVHSNTLDFYGPTLIEQSAGAAVIIAREPYYGTQSVYDVRFYGELRLRKSNTRQEVDHGAIHINNPDTLGSIERVLFEGPVIAVDTGVLRTTMPSAQFWAHGSGKIQAEIRNMQFYGRGPTTRLIKDVSSTSSVNAVGWSNTTPYLAAEPPYPLSN